MSTNMSINMERGVEAMNWTEPVDEGISLVEYKSGMFEIDGALQNRIGLEANPEAGGYFCTAAKTKAIAEYFILQAEQGIKAADCVPPVTVGMFEDKMWIIGGHGRLSGLELARHGVENGMLEDLFEDDEVETDFAAHFKNVYVRTYKCETRRDLETLAGLENSASQNGDRLTDKEIIALIEAALRDPMKAQFKDAALGIKFLGASGLGKNTMRNKINNIRRRMYKKGETPYQQGVINIHGKPMKPSRPGTTTLKELEIIIRQLDTEYDYIAELEDDKKNDKTYNGFESVVKKFRKKLELATTWLAEEELAEIETWFDALWVRIGYTDMKEETNAASDGEGVNVTTSESGDKSDDKPSAGTNTNEGADDGAPKTSTQIASEQSTDDSAVNAAAKIAAQVQAKQAEMNLDTKTATPSKATTPAAPAPEQTESAPESPEPEIDDGDDLAQRLGYSLRDLTVIRDQVRIDCKEIPVGLDAAEKMDDALQLLTQAIAQAEGKK